MKSIFLILINLLFSVTISFAQNNKTDSLKNLLKTAKEDTNRVNILNAIALEFMGSGNYDSAMKLAYDAEGLAQKLEFKKGIAQSFSNLGLVYWRMGNYPESLKNHLQALKIREEIGDRQGMGGSYLNIGNLYLNQRIYPEALKNYLQALTILQQTGNKRGISLCYTNIGIICYVQGNYAEALKNYGQALKIKEAIGDAGGLASCYNNMGDVYAAQNKYEDALKNYFLAMEIWKKNGNKPGVAVCYLGIGSVLIKQKEYKEAGKYLVEALQAAKELGSKDNLKDGYSKLAELSEATGDYKSAYKYHRLYSEIKDSLLNESNSKQMAEMKANFEMEKKDKEIEIQTIKIGRQKAAARYLISGFLLLTVFAYVAFRLYNQKRKIAFQQQVAETNMRALLSQIDSHFISNTLVSIKNFLSGNDRQSSIDVTDKFAVLMREVLANSRRKEITVKEDVETLENYLQIQKVNHLNKFDFEIKIAADIRPEEMLIPPMMIQPFVENSIKHGFREIKSGGMIRINMNTDNSALPEDGSVLRLICTIDDNGMGRNRADGISQSNHHNGIGTEVIKERMEILNRSASIKSRFEYEDVTNDNGDISGTRVRLYLPYSL